MLLLAFDTSSPAVTVALVEQPAPPADIEPGESFVALGAGPQVLAERTEVAANRHGELLAPLIAQVLAEARATPSDLAAIGVGLGPGPFTGLRVGIVTAKAMGDALGIPVYGECSLDVMAMQASGWSSGEDNDDELWFAVLSDARRKQVYWATYDYDGKRQSGPELSPPTEVAEALRGRISHLAGAGAQLYADVFADFVCNDVVLYPSGSELADRVMPKLIRRQPSDDVTPLYLRRPDAVPPGAPKQVTPA